MVPKRSLKILYKYMKSILPRSMFYKPASKAASLWAKDLINYCCVTRTHPPPRSSFSFKFPLNHPSQSPLKPPEAPIHPPAFSPTAPSLFALHTPSSPSNFSNFHISAFSLHSSRASSPASQAALRCAEETAMRMDTSPIGTTPRRWIREIAEVGFSWGRGEREGRGRGGKEKERGGRRLWKLKSSGIMDGRRCTYHPGCVSLSSLLRFSEGFARRGGCRIGIRGGLLFLNRSCRGLCLIMSNLWVRYGSGGFDRLCSEGKGMWYLRIERLHQLSAI